MKILFAILLFISANVFARESCVIVKQNPPVYVQTYSSQPEDSFGQDKQEHFVVGTIGFVLCDMALKNHVEHSKGTCAGLGLLAMIAKEKTDDVFSTRDIAAGMAGMELGAAIRIPF